MGGVDTIIFVVIVPPDFEIWWSFSGVFLVLKPLFNTEKQLPNFKSCGSDYARKD